MMRRAFIRNLELVKTVAQCLGPLLDKMVFLGGAATELLITGKADPGRRNIR